jgi:mediator of RNA polymerase II transcription subunit 23
VNKYVDAVNDLIWKYNIVTIDRLLLCMARRTQEGNEAQVSFFIIQLLLLKNPEFRNRVQEFIKNSPEHWKLSQWHEKHLAFHAKFPEKFVPEEARTQQPHSVYFGNVCLRFLPVFDIVIHRFLEVCVVPAIKNSLEVILEHLGVLYKFHDRPITYLYNTLHYYERKLRDRPSMKKKLVGAIVNSMKDVRPANWALTEPYQKHYIQYQLPDQPISNEILWNPDITYYFALVKRLIDTIDGKNMFPGVDWRFNEFPNQPTHALYVTCVELLGLPAGPSVVSNNIFDVLIKGYTLIQPNEIHKWTNAIGLIMSNLPEAYWSVIYDRLEEIMRQPTMVEWPYRHSPFDLFNYKTVRDAMLEKNFVLMLAIAHSIFHHFGVGQTAKIIE